MTTMIQDMRRSNAAGRFFPGDAQALAEKVEALMQEAGEIFLPPRSVPMAVISPHAGYDYSGLLTAGALRMSAGGAFDRVAILSPSHRHAFDGIALPAQDGYVLPGVSLPIDAAARQALVGAGLARVLDAAHDHEHGIETQLPFVTALHEAAPVVPLVIGRAERRHVARVVDALAAMPGRTLFVLSSDLSHFLTRTEANARDKATAEMIETGQHKELTGEDACGAAAIAGFMASEHARGARVMRLGMTTSYGTTGDASRVVGYGAWSLHAPHEDMLHETHRAALLKAARQALEGHTRQRVTPGIRMASFSPRLQGIAASFVTLEKRGELRGCIGSLMPHAPLVQDVVDNAVKAGFSDRRFGPMSEEELAETAIKLSVLSRPVAMKFDGETQAREMLEPGKSGAILIDGPYRGVFLPSVWESLPTREAFLNGLKRKAGLPESHWSDRVKILGFRAEAFGEAA
ncbi:AmmeMemoRadiSam system protein B [Marimonas lutisalis]|uniref:AmmeMemoRadiSam system protein B n=1 Tax=Marimonas lutisalis TaxID=2545756 RepID=UPI0010F43D6E|nr:AmmeMemoRadiSam system protein B [Marimonas lutisalis]